MYNWVLGSGGAQRRFDARGSHKRGHGAKVSSLEPALARKPRKTRAPAAGGIYIARDSNARCLGAPIRGARFGMFGDSRWIARDEF